MKLTTRALSILLLSITGLGAQGCANESDEGSETMSDEAPAATVEDDTLAPKMISQVKKPTLPPAGGISSVSLSFGSTTTSLDSSGDEGRASLYALRTMH